MTCLTLADLQRFCPLTLGLVSQYIEVLFFCTKGKWPGIRNMNKLYFGVQTMVSSQKQPQLMPCTTEVQKEWAAGHSSGASTWSSLCLDCLDGKDEVLITTCIYIYIFIYLYICIFIYLYIYIYIFIYLFFCLFILTWFQRNPCWSNMIQHDSMAGSHHWVHRVPKETATVPQIVPQVIGDDTGGRSAVCDSSPKKTSIFSSASFRFFFRLITYLFVQFPSSTPWTLAAITGTHSCHPWNRPWDSVPRRRPAVQRPESARDFLSWNRRLMYFPEISVLGDFKQPLESVEMIPMIQRCLAHITIGPCLCKATRPPQINRLTWVPSGYLT